MIETVADGFSFYDPAFARDPWSIYAALRRESGPAVWLPRERCWLLLGYGVVKTALGNPVFTVDHPFRASRILLGGPTILDLEGEEHSRLRAPIGRGFGKRIVDAKADPLIDSILAGLLQDFETRGEADLVADFAEILPIAVTCALLGLDEVVPRHLYDELRPVTRFLDNPREGQADAMRARDGLVATIRRTGTAPDCHGVLADIFSEAKDADEAVRMVILTLVGGSETSACVIANLIHVLRDAPAQIESLLADPARAAACVMETVRWEAPTALTVRFAAEDAEVAGMQIPKGATVILSIAAANRDPTVFSDPDRWDPDRELQSVISFGRGHHACPGFYLARREIVRALLFLAAHWDRFDWRRTPFGAPNDIHGRTFRMPRALPARIRTCVEIQGRTA